MKRAAMIVTLLGVFFVSAAAPASASVFVRRPVAPVRTAVRVAASPHRPYIGPRVYARPGVFVGRPYWGPGWGFGRGVSVGVGVY
jgi:hypothetical protein